MYMTSDPVADWNRHCEEVEEALKDYPVCDYCGEVITDEQYYDFGGEIICEDCMDKYRRWTEDYVEEQRERRY